MDVRTAEPRASLAPTGEGLSAERRSLILSGCFRTPLGFELERLVALTDDPEISLWVASAPGLRTSTVAAHLAFDRTPEVHDRLRVHPQAPLEEMRSVPAHRHSPCGIVRFAERSLFEVPEGLAQDLLERFPNDTRPLGELWDEVASRYLFWAA